MQNFGTGAVTPPWVVNLDHALLKSNIDHERAIAVIGQEIFSFPSRIKSIIASGEFKIEKRPMDASALAYNQDVLDALKREYRNGRKLFLCSALPYSVVKAVCDYHGIFSGFFVLDAASQKRTGRRPQEHSPRVWLNHRRFRTHFLASGHRRIDGCGARFWAKRRASLDERPIDHFRNPSTPVVEERAGFCAGNGVASLNYRELVSVDTCIFGVFARRLNQLCVTTFSTTS